MSWEVIPIKISTRGRYGLEAILDIAIHQNDGPVSLKGIAERQGISDKYLEQLFIILKKHKIIKSTRGAQGGYMLAKASKEITVKDILDILEGPLSPVSCILDEQSCDRIEYCVTKKLWKRIMDELNAIAENTTIADLIACYEELDSGMRESLQYYI